MKYGLDESTIEKICQVFTRYPAIRQAVLYGSRAKGNYKNGSDIDIVLESDDTLTLDVLRRISGDIDDLMLPYSVDLSVLSFINNPDLLDHIRRVGVVLYGVNSQYSQQ